MWATGDIMWSLFKSTDYDMGTVSLETWGSPHLTMERITIKL